jgi:uncharacterized protein YceK
MIAAVAGRNYFVYGDGTMKNALVAMACLLLLFLSGCSSEPTKTAPEEKSQPKAAEAVTGRTAFQKLYISARGWARDAQPYRVQSDIISDAKGRDGKAAVWRGSFASVSQRATKPYTWAKGEIDPGTIDSYSQGNSSTKVFDIAFLKVDSDKAFEVAQKHGGDKMLEKNADVGVFYTLDWSSATSELIWHVWYGSSRDDPKLRIAVNASTGEFIRVEK